MVTFRPLVERLRTAVQLSLGALRREPGDERVECKRPAVDNELMLLGVHPHWAMAIFEEGKDVENKPKTKKYPFGAQSRWVGVVTTALVVREPGERAVAKCAGREPRAPRAYTCAKKLVGFIFIGPPTPETAASKWAIAEVRHEATEKKPSKVVEYDQWEIQHVVRLKQAIPGFNAPQGLPQRARLQLDAMKKLKAMKNILARPSEFRWER
jgi:hypothetical protein